MGTNALTLGKAASRARKAHTPRTLRVLAAVGGAFCLGAALQRKMPLRFAHCVCFLPPEETLFSVGQSYGKKPLARERRGVEIGGESQPPKIL